MGLKELRIKHEYSQESLSLKTGLSIRTIQRIEKENKASDSSLYQLSKVFNIEVEELKSIIMQSNVKEKINEYEEKFFFYLVRHPNFIRFIIINVFLFLLNIITSPDKLWFYYVLIPWGFALLYDKYDKFQENKKLH